LERLAPFNHTQGRDQVREYLRNGASDLASEADGGLDSRHRVGALDPGDQGDRTSDAAGEVGLAEAEKAAVGPEKIG
jgi:hypothetical protein